MPLGALPAGVRRQPMMMAWFMISFLTRRRHECRRGTHECVRYG
jgi:hypothetical protein